MIIITSAPHQWEITHPVLLTTKGEDQLTAFLHLWSHDLFPRINTAAGISRPLYSA